MVKIKAEQNSFLHNNISLIFTLFIALAGLAVSWGIYKDQLDHLKEELLDLKANFVNLDKIENLRIQISTLDKEVTNISANLKDMQREIQHLDNRIPNGRR